MVEVLVGLQGTILIYMGFGFILRKTNLINQEASNFLSRFILEFVHPVNMFYSCLNSFTLEIIQSCILVLGIAIIVELAEYFLAKMHFPGCTEGQQKVASYGLMVSNGGLIGTPVIEGLYGGMGVVYANIFMIPTRVVAYTAGESLFNPQKKKTMKDSIMALITNKVIVGMMLGIVGAMLGIHMPGFVNNALQGISKCMAPLSLILIGSMLAEKMSFKFEEDIKIIALSMMRQIVIPLVVVICLIPVNLDPIAKSSAALLLGMPIGTFCAIFANRYHCEEGFASKTVFISTISSTFTLIAVMWMVEMILF